MGDRWSLGKEDGWLHLDGGVFAFVAVDESRALGYGDDNARLAALMVEVLNGDPRTNPPKVEMVPWAEVDTRPGKHLPAEGSWWIDRRTDREDPHLTAKGTKAPTLSVTYYRGSLVPVRSSDGEQA